MSRTKKTRRIKGKTDIKTGSKKDFIPRGQKGSIPSHNRLAKHRDKQKPAYLKFLEEKNQKESDEPAADSGEDDGGAASG